MLNLQATSPWIGEEDHVDENEKTAPAATMKRLRRAINPSTSALLAGYESPNAIIKVLILGI